MIRTTTSDVRALRKPRAVEDVSHVPTGRAPRSLFITQDFPPRLGGFQSYYWGLIQTLDAEDVVILASDHPGAASFDATHPYRVVRHPRSILLPTPALRRSAERLIAEHDLRLVQLGQTLPNGLLGPALKRRTGLPYLVLLAGAELTLPAALPGSGAAVRHVLGRAALLLTVSGYTAAAVERVVAGKVPVAVLRPALDLDGLDGPGMPAVKSNAADTTLPGVRAGGPLVVCVGRLVPRKGQDRLIDALALLTPRYPGLELALVGSGRLAASLGRRAQRLGVGDRVHLLGALPRSRVAEWLAAADVFASPCRVRWGGLEVEGFGIVFAEAAAAGLPVLAGRSGGAPEAVADGDTGIVIDGSSASEVAAGLERILRLGSAGRRMMGERGRVLARERHAPAVVGRRYRELLWRAARAGTPGDGRERS